MAEKIVDTIAGPFDRERYKRLCETLDSVDGEVVQFEGQDLLVAFGKYLREFLSWKFGT